MSCRFGTAYAYCWWTYLVNIYIFHISCFSSSLPLSIYSLLIRSFSFNFVIVFVFYIHCIPTTKLIYEMVYSTNVTLNAIVLSEPVVATKYSWRAILLMIMMNTITKTYPTWSTHPSEKEALFQKHGYYFNIICWHEILLLLLCDIFRKDYFIDSRMTGHRAILVCLNCGKWVLGKSINFVVISIIIIINSLITTVPVRGILNPLGYTAY